MTKSHFIGRCSSLSVVMAQRLSQLCFGCDHGNIRGRKWQSRLSIFTQLFHLHFSPRSWGRSLSVIFPSGAFPHCSGKDENNTSASPSCLTFLEEKWLQQERTSYSVTKVILTLMTVTRGQRNFWTLPGSLVTPGQALSSRPMRWCAWLYCPLEKWTIELFIPQTGPCLLRPGLCGRRFVWVVFPLYL